MRSMASRDRDRRVSRVQKFYATTLGDVAKMAVDLHLDCRRCRHHSMLDVQFLAQMHGDWLNLGMMKGRARCSQCHERNADVLMRQRGERGDKAWWPHPPIGRG